MADTQEPAEVEAVEEQSVEAPRLTARNSQAAYDASRRERKARAAVTVKKNAEDAKKAKAKVQAKASRPKGTAAFMKRAAEIEARHEASRKAKAEDK